MKRLLAIFALTIAGLFASFTISLVPSVAAIDVFPVCNPGSDPSATDGRDTDVCQEINDPSKQGENPVIKVLRVAIIILSIIIGFAAVVLIIIAGLSFMTANGDAQAMARARSGLVYALVGIVIVVLAQSLVAFVLNKL